MKRRAQQAFTLVELVVVLGIAALMVGFMLKLLQTKPSTDCYEQTRVEMADIQVAIENFVRDNNRYPKPSNIALGTSNAAFGTEASTGTVTASSSVIGGLPTTALGLSTNYADDCWGSKYIYAVTTDMTTTPGFTDSSKLGTLIVKHGPLASPIATLTTKAAYVIVSNGADKDGATPLSGGTVTAGSCTLSTTKIDTENCDVGVGANTTYFTAEFNNGASATNFYDDLIVFAEKAGVVHTDCLAGNVTWLTNCGVTFATSVPHGTVYAGMVSTIPPSTAGYAGSATITCDEGTFSTTATSCTAGRTPLCYEVDGDPGVCGKYYYTDGSTEVDSTPCDHVGMTPPAGWSWCSGGGSGCDNGLSEDNGYCDVATCYRCCGNVSQTYGNPYGAARALTLGACAWPGGPSGNCSAGSRNWDHCGSTYGALTEGSSVTMSNTTGEPFYEGSSTATCSGGVVSFSGESCTYSCAGGCTTNGMCLQEGDYYYQDASCVRQVCCSGAIQLQHMAICPSGDAIGSTACH